MENEIKIEKAVLADARRWCQIRKECWLLTYPNKEFGITKEDLLQKDFDSPEKIKGWQDSFANPNGCKYYSAKLNGAVVGICIAYDDPVANEIGAIYIDPAYHGRGIGWTLIRAAIAGFDRIGPTKLKVVQYNETAINFYKKLGFKMVGPVDDPFGKLPNGKFLPEVEMTLEPNLGQNEKR